MQNLTQFGKVAADTAMIAARDYLRQNPKPYDIDDLVVCLRRECKKQLPIALADAKSAFECGMDKIATVTFLASMKLAGIAAAKSCKTTK